VAKGLRNPGAKPSMGQDPEIWLPGFTSRIAPDFVPPGFDLPETFWLMDPLSFDELEAARNNTCPGLDVCDFPSSKHCLFLKFLMTF
jgi:hypothetical protein